MKAQGKELKEAGSQRKLAMHEFSEMSERLTELRSQKQRLSRQLRDKEEEMDALNQKLEGLRLELRKVERTKKEVGRILRCQTRVFNQIFKKCNVNVKRVLVDLYICIRWKPRLRSMLWKPRKRRS